ncbi:hypothetical protein DFQ29_003936 [Apophysomyces sp. BC1021]|nr:hypothetical protein DFQ29_003936 [Apophysomyces sp. BC1021]
MVAQSITYLDEQKLSSDEKHGLHLRERLPKNLQEHQALWPPPPPSWDAARTMRFALYSFCVAPIAGRWYMLLDSVFPMPQGNGRHMNRKRDIVAIKRMITDQTMFAPAGLTLFFTVMGYAESGKWRGVQEKFHDAFVPALITNYKIWPLVQFINFKFMPIQYRVPFVSSLGILWNVYLSWINNASKQEEFVLEHFENL